MCGSIWTIKRHKQAKCLLFHKFYPHSRISFFLLPQKANLFLLCLFLFSQRLEMKEQSQVAVRNQRPTAAGNYLEYFVPFALSTPWSAAGAVKITRCRQDPESIHSASKFTLGPLSLPFFPHSSVLIKISSKEGHSNSMAIC